MSKQKKDKTESKILELENKYKRALADYLNLEKRFAKESESVVKFANTTILAKILEIKDNLERAATSIDDEGINMILSQLDSLLKEEMVTEIQAKGSEYDPEKMEAEEVVPGKKNKVIEVAQKGYLIHDRVLRPAKVKVGSGQKANK